MDFERRLAGQLSAALLAVAWTPDSLAAALDVFFGARRKTRSSRLLRALLAEMGNGAPPPASIRLAQFFEGSDDFARLAEQLERAVIRAPLVLSPPLFAPSGHFVGLAVPVLATPDDLARWLGLTLRELEWFADERRAHRRTASVKLQHYRYRFVPKASGPPRLLEAPKPRLKDIQRKILREILDAVPVHAAAFGFVAGRSCIQAAGRHAGERVVIALDLKDFFLTAPLPRVHALFRHLGYPHAVATLLTRLCSTSTPLRALDGARLDFSTRKRFEAQHLPQGAPTSPALTNLIAFRLDKRLSGLAQRFDAQYSRYADDLAFSGGVGLLRNASAFLAAVTEIAESEGFVVHPKKTRVMASHGRQKLTGIVVNDHVNVARDEYDRLKAILHNCRHSGFEAANRDGATNFAQQLAGRVAWIEQLNPARGMRLRRMLGLVPTVSFRQTTHRPFRDSLTPMRAMVLRRPRQRLVLEERPEPQPGPGEIRIKVEACGVCRTDLHVVDGDLPNPKLPIVPGHEVVGRVDAVGAGVPLVIGARVGAPWLGHTCGHCRYCLAGRENLCDAPLFHGYTRDGGFATHMVADAVYAFPLAEELDAAAAAPLLCAGLIGWRSLKAAGPAERIGLYGFGAAAHIIAQVCRAEGRRVFAFTRRGDEASQEFARTLGAEWAGSSDEKPPFELDAAILFAPVGALVPAALSCLRKGGRVVCAGIHMSDIPSFPYSLLWQERSIVSVANLTRADGEEFLTLAPRLGVRTTTKAYPLEQANEALDDLREGRFEGAAVLTI